MRETEQRGVSRRVHRRVHLKLPIRLSTIDSEIDPATGRACFRTSEEVCANISRGGAFITTGDPLAAGRRVLVEIDLPGGDVVEAVGRVAWTRLLMKQGATTAEMGLGIEFIGGDPDHLALLERHIDAVERAAVETVRQRFPTISARGANPTGGA